MEFLNSETLVIKDYFYDKKIIYSQLVKLFCQQ